MTKKPDPKKPNVFQGDLSDDFFSLYSKDDSLAVDCEMMGLNPRRDRLCVIQICGSENTTSLVQILPGQRIAPKIQELFEDSKIQKVFHFARMDFCFLRARLGIQLSNIFCTKIASRLARTYTDKHGLKELIREFFDENMDKKNQSSDWGKKILTKDQIEYASADVKYLISLSHILASMLEREGRMELAQKCFDFLPTVVEMDLMEIQGIFEH